MELQKINVKFFTERADEPPLVDFIDVFQSWIQESEGAFHDVADYSHMQAGPGIVLVAHDANVSIDEAGKRRGLLYSQKSALTGSNRQKLENVLHSAIENGLRLERHATLKDKLRFFGGELLVYVNDRLLAPNSDEAFEAMRADLAPVLTCLYRSNDLVLERDADPRQRLNVRVKAFRSYALDELLRNLQG